MPPASRRARTRRRRLGLNGNKHFISDGDYSDFFVVSAVTDPGAGARDVSLFIVDKDMPGFTVGRDQKMMGLRGTSHVELFFDNVKLDAGAPARRQEGQGLKLALRDARPHAPGAGRRARGRQGRRASSS